VKLGLIAAEWPNEEGVGGVGLFNQRLVHELLEHGNHVTIFTNKNITVGHDLCTVKTLKVGKSRFGRYYLFPIILSLLLMSKKFSFDMIISSGDDWAILHQQKTVRVFHGTAKGELKGARKIRQVNHLFLYSLELLSSKRVPNKFATGPDSCKVFDAKFFPPIIGIRKRGLPKTVNPSIIFVGAFWGRKRGYIANNIVHELRKKIPKLEFIVITNRRDASLFSKADKVLVNVTEEEKQFAISRAWILLSTSTYEGFGIPTFEAMLEGTVPVSIPNPGSRLLLREFPELLTSELHLEETCSNLLTNWQKILNLSRCCEIEAKKLIQIGTIERLLKREISPTFYDK